MQYLIGIDGGGSRTTAWIINGSGAILAQVSSGPSNPCKVGWAAAERRVLAIARKAVREARLGRIVLEALCAGVAGVDRPFTRRRLEAALRRAIPARRYLVTTDGIIALASAVGESPGVIVISGTGSIAYGRDENGRIFRCGGWGSVFDDAGSGYDIGRRAIGSALRDFDGRGAHTRLGGAICQELKLRQITDAVGAALPPNRIAGLFPVVKRVAARGDPVARKLCWEAGQHLAELVRALLERMGGRNQKLPVVCGGGVFKASARVRRSFGRSLREYAPNVHIALLGREPVEGALALAKNLAATRPPAEP